MREKRRYQRAALSTSVTIAAGDGETWQAESRDISQGGLFVCGVARAPIGTSVTLHFELPGLGPAQFPAFIRWTTAEGFGLQFGLLGARETHAIGMLVRSENHTARSG